MVWDCRGGSAEWNREQRNREGTVHLNNFQRKSDLQGAAADTNWSKRRKGRLAVGRGQVAQGIRMGRSF